MNIQDLTLCQIKNIINSVSEFKTDDAKKISSVVGRRCVVRTYSAGVHIGIVSSMDGMEVTLTDALRLWKWSGGGLSLSAIANNGIKSGRLNFTGEIVLTNAIEVIPCTEKAYQSYLKFIEDLEV